MARFPRSLKSKLDKLNTDKDKLYLTTRRTGARTKDQSSQVLLDDGRDYATVSHDINEKDYYRNFNRAMIM